jgi:hypothetical protein
VSLKLQQVITELHGAYLATQQFFVPVQASPEHWRVPQLTPRHVFEHELGHGSAELVP